MRGRRIRSFSKKLIPLLLAVVMAWSCIPFETFAAGSGNAQGYRLEDGTLAPIGTDEAMQMVESAGDGTMVAGKTSRISAALTLRMLETYPTYLFFNPVYAPLSSSGYYLFYSPDGNDWNYSFTWGSSIEVTGLKPDTEYTIRLFSGNLNVYFGETKVRTGKPIKVKSVSVKAVKVKKKRERRRTPYLGLPLSGYWTYYTYKVKITVKLKQKPGTPGIYINGIWKKGNKKKYTVTLPGRFIWWSKKSPKGRAKVNVTVYSALDPNGYGGHSQLWSKTKKAK